MRIHISPTDEQRAKYAPVQNLGRSLGNDYAALGIVADALAAAQSDGNIGPSVRATVTTHGSRSHNIGVEVTLFSETHDRADGKRRRPNMSNTALAATYEEWGYFLANVFYAAPDAKAGPYTGVDDFDDRTRYAFDASTVSA